MYKHRKIATPPYLDKLVRELNIAEEPFLSFHVAYVNWKLRVVKDQSQCGYTRQRWLKQIKRFVTRSRQKAGRDHQSPIIAEDMRVCI